MGMTIKACRVGCIKAALTTLIQLQALVATIAVLI